MRNLRTEEPAIALLESLPVGSTLVELFDRMEDIVFFAKDGEGRYILANRTLVERCGLSERSHLIGRTAVDIFPEPLGRSFLAQDQRVFRRELTISDRLELHLYRDGREGWCLTYKRPLRDRAGRVVGSIGFSRDLGAPADGGEGYAVIAACIEYARNHLAEGLRVEELARRASLSIHQFDRRIRGIFGITPRQLLAKLRIEHGSRLLREEPHSIAAIALECGYSDQSAFARQFKSMVGLTPRQYRDTVG